MEDLEKYIGKKYMAGGKVKREYTITDILITTNMKGDIVKRCFVAYNEMLGQKVYDYEVPVAEVMRALKLWEVKFIKRGKIMYKLSYIVKNGSKKRYICECASKKTLERDIPLYKKQLPKAHKFCIDKVWWSNNFRVILEHIYLVCSINYFFVVKAINCKCWETL